MHGGAAGGPDVGNMEIGTADGQITMSRVNSGGASGGLHVLQKLRVVLQSTLQQLHKVQSMLHTRRSKLLNILHKLQNKLPAQLRVGLQSTLHQVHKLQNMLHALRREVLNVLHKLQNKLANQLRVVLQSTLHQVHKLQMRELRSTRSS